jgi:hypothetical protein
MHRIPEDNIIKVYGYSYEIKQTEFGLEADYIL